MRWLIYITLPAATTTSASQAIDINSNILIAVSKVLWYTHGLDVASKVRSALHVSPNKWASHPWGGGEGGEGGGWRGGEGDGGRHCPTPHFSLLYACKSSCRGTCNTRQYSNWMQVKQSVRKPLHKTSLNIPLCNIGKLNSVEQYYTQPEVNPIATIRGLIKKRQS